jgi:Zn-dependent alcohol dehydrogenase
VTGKRGLLVLLVLTSLLLAGCKRDAEINAALGEIDSFTNELRERIKNAPNPTTGVDDAQQYLDSRKREIKAKASFLTRVRGVNASDQTIKRLVETVRRNQLTIVSLQTEFANLSMSNTAFKTKLDKLVNDYLELFQS